MVEYKLNFDHVFQALGDSTRRDILQRVLASEQRISDLAQEYSMSFAGVAKHLDVLVRAKLVTKQKRGREQVVSANAAAITQTTQLLQQYEQIWTERFHRFDTFMENNKEGK